MCEAEFSPEQFETFYSQEFSKPISKSLKAEDLRTSA